MYNRYIPQPDGSYQKNRMPDGSPPSYRPSPSFPSPEPAGERNHSQQPSPHQRSGQPCGNSRPPRRPSPPPKSQPFRESPRQSGGVLNFFRNLLPSDFDTEDLLIVLLLLLMSGDCKEDQNTALLTLALYLFL